jgi:hypothetical protein
MALRPFYELMPFFYLNIVDDTKPVGLTPPISQVEFVHAGLRPNWYTEHRPYVGGMTTKINKDTDYTNSLNTFQRKIQLAKGKLDNAGSSQLTHFSEIQDNLSIPEVTDQDGPLWGRAYARSTECPKKPDGHTLIVVGHCPTTSIFERFTTLKTNHKDTYEGCGIDKHCVYTDCGKSLAFVDVASSAAFDTDANTPVEMLYLEHTTAATDRYYNKMERLVLDGRPTIALADPIIPKKLIPFQAGGSRFNRTRSKRTNLRRRSRKH